MITPVFYQKISDDIDGAASYYFMSNLIGADNNLDERFIDHETESIKARNRAIGYAIISGECPDTVNMDSAMIAISSMRKGIVVIAEY